MSEVGFCFIVFRGDVMFDEVLKMFVESVMRCEVVVIDLEDGKSGVDEDLLCVLWDWEYDVFDCFFDCLCCMLVVFVLVLFFGVFFFLGLIKDMCLEVFLLLDYLLL